MGVGITGFPILPTNEAEMGMERSESEGSQAREVPKVPSVGRMLPAGELCSNSHPSCGKPTSSLQKTTRLIYFAQ